MTIFHLSLNIYEAVKILSQFRNILTMKTSLNRNHKKRKILYGGRTHSGR
jgi:hypothetical protein